MLSFTPSTRRVLARLNAHPALPAPSKWALQLAWIIACWNDRFRSRRQLSRLESERLQDLGLNQRNVIEESDKPFWQS